MNKNDTPTTSAYGRRPLWQWILIYVIVGGAIYAAIYYFMYKPADGAKYQTNTSAQTQTAPVAQPSASPAAGMAPASTPAPAQQSMPASKPYSW